MRSKLILSMALCWCITSCAVLDYPLSIFNEETGETTEVPLGDIIASSSESVGDTIATAVTGFTGGNGLLGVVAGAAAAALLGGAARRKKAAAVAKAKEGDPAD